MPLLHQEWVGAGPWGCAGHLKTQEAIRCGAHPAAGVRLADSAQGFGAWPSARTGGPAATRGGTATAATCTGQCKAQSQSREYSKGLED